ncbi:hypothetical protein H2248_009141 [Termitomyces sp. 'cryptogamus']|nr:hypothetical protein H2248_009141 [Termitomyces sp. 'cryptogamus']
MTSVMQRKRHSLKRHLNRLEHRATEAAPSSASLISDSGSSPSTSMVPASSLPPTSVAAIATVLSLISAAIILGIVICVYRRYKRRTSKMSPNTLAGKVIMETEDQPYSQKRIDLTDVSIYTEKPEKAVLTHSFDEPAGWVPQIKAYPPTNLSFPEPTASPKNDSPKFSVKTTLDTPQPSPSDYLMANDASREDQSPRFNSIPPCPAISTTGLAALTFPANRRTKTSLVPPAEQPMQNLSPRSESFTPQDPFYPSSPDSDQPTQKLPRLMTVSASFTPTLDDELAIKLGDIVRMLEEYKDGWCFVQRVGRIDAPKGAVPRFCLQERRGVVPIVPSRKYSTGLLKSQASSWH